MRKYSYFTLPLKIKNADLSPIVWNLGCCGQISNIISEMPILDVHTSLGVTTLYDVDSKLKRLCRCS